MKIAFVWKMNCCQKAYPHLQSARQKKKNAYSFQELFLTLKYTWKFYSDLSGLELWLELLLYEH